jgi:putative FmdB family regulatory protein
VRVFPDVSFWHFSDMVARRHLPEVRSEADISSIGSVEEREVPTYQYRCKKCGKSFERTETITEHDKAKVKCPNGRKVTQVPARVHVVTSRKS